MSTSSSALSQTILPIANLENVIVAFRSPLEAATSAITAKYSELGGASGVLGPPDGEISPCQDGRGYFRHFWNNGSIYWSPETGAHATCGSIREKWASLGWERSFLRYPASDVAAGNHPQTVGTYQVFQGGAIYDHAEIAHSSVLAEAGGLKLALSQEVRIAPQIAATAVQPIIGTPVIGHAGGLAHPPKPSIANTHEVHGAILAKYRELGAESSILGYPTTDETGCPDGVGRFNHCQAGSIYWTPSTGAHEVHGLIRDFWAAHGWERNPALGYPISDELIPDRRIGHVRPESQRKPVLNLPADVVKLPVEAVSAGNVPLIAVNRMTSPKILAVSEVRPDLGVLAGLLTPQPASTPAPERSVNRFSDFENGILFWQRGSGAAESGTPWNKAADGTVIQKSASDIVAAAFAHVAGALQLPGGTPMPVFAGTAPYSWDGAGTQNRRHQIQVNVMVMEGFPIPMPHVHSVTLSILVTFEPERRKISGYLAEYAGDPVFAQRLDPLLWSAFDILTFPDTNAGKPISILAVKTMPNGDVNTYIEPETAPLAKAIVAVPAGRIF